MTEDLYPNIFCPPLEYQQFNIPPIAITPEDQNQEQVLPPTEILPIEHFVVYPAETSKTEAQQSVPVPVENVFQSPAYHSAAFAWISLQLWFCWIGVVLVHEETHLHRFLCNNLLFIRIFLLASPAVAVILGLFFIFCRRSLVKVVFFIIIGLYAISLGLLLVKPHEKALSAVQDLLAINAAVFAILTTLVSVADQKVATSGLMQMAITTLLASTFSVLRGSHWGIDEVTSAIVGAGCALCANIPAVLVMKNWARTTPNDEAADTRNTLCKRLRAWLDQRTEEDDSKDPHSVSWLPVVLTINYLLCVGWVLM
ncbi:hypothetical protein Pelo_14504 [Pelomyxa schiedti]|nr:hypothetical protein Pelo_14504 [Pelomyxa schiedti]